MPKICSFAQRQDGHVVGLVSIVNNLPDISTCRLIIGEPKEGEEHGMTAARMLEEHTRLRAAFVVPMFTYTNPEGEETVVWDMDIKKPIDMRPKDPSVAVMWCNPWHLVNGPDGDLARQYFEFNGTRVSEPVVYRGKVNTDFVLDLNANPEEDGE